MQVLKNGHLPLLKKNTVTNRLSHKINKKNSAKHYLDVFFL